MATELITPIYGRMPPTPEEQARKSAINALHDAKIYLLKSLTKEDETVIDEGMELIVKLDKIENKVKKL